MDAEEFLAALDAKGRRRPKRLCRNSSRYFDEFAAARGRGRNRLLRRPRFDDLDPQLFQLLRRHRPRGFDHPFEPNDGIVNLFTSVESYPSPDLCGEKFRDPPTEFVPTSNRYTPDESGGSSADHREWKTIFY